MRKKIITRTGQEVEVSGIYRPSASQDEVTLEKGKTTPPNREGKRPIFTLEKRTHHKRRKK